MKKTAMVGVTINMQFHLQNCIFSAQLFEKSTRMKKHFTCFA